MAKYPDIKGPDDMTPAVGVANAYDAMMLAALAIAPPARPTATRSARRSTRSTSYEGLIKTYAKPFSAGNHDALSENDYVWAQFIDNRILPVGPRTRISRCPALAALSRLTHAARPRSSPALASAACTG